MRKTLPLGRSTCSTLRTQNKIHVDKTELIYYSVEVLLINLEKRLKRFAQASFQTKDVVSFDP